MFGLFKKPKARSPVVDQIHSKLLSRDINEEVENVEKIFLDIKENIPFSFVTKRELEVSSVGELRRESNDVYKFYVIVELVGRDGSISDQGIDLLLRAISCATISKIAESQNRPEYVLEENKCVGFGDINKRHPLNDFFS